MSIKILHISDTHGFHKDLPERVFDNIDVVIHSGDCSNWRDPARNLNEVHDFAEWYMTVPVKHKIYVAGNHDTSIERRMFKQVNFEDRGIVYLEHDSVIIDGVKIFGSPYTPTFGEWAFMKSRETINRVWETMPTDIDVLVTHGPAKGVRDLSEEFNGELKQCGDSALMKWIFMYKPKAHLFGHIHDMKGINNQGLSKYSKSPTKFSNAACVTDGRFDLGLTSHGNIITID
jgi:Icc-related predicted phosphoesterase